MPKLVIHQEKVEDPQVLVDICPFGAMEEKDGKLSINAACKMCKLCVKKGPAGAVEYVEDEKKEEIDKSQWNGIAVYVDHVDGEIHPVTYELIGKARELASKINHPVYALFMGNNISDKAEELLHYGVDKVFVYDFPELARFKIESYTSVFEDFIKKHQPCAILTGATTVGRQLAPRVAARMKTGLTADCTKLDIDEETKLLMMTRPAFGGNIMATIVCEDFRPQMATVRPGVMKALEADESRQGEVEVVEVNFTDADMNVKIREVVKTTHKSVDITEAKILVAGGRGVGNAEGFKDLEALADTLDGEVAASRAAVDSGWISNDRQVGQTGKTVRPELYLACGISGAIQHAAGMENSEFIVAINRDEDAAIFDIADLGVVGDIKKILPKLNDAIKAVKEK